MLLVGCAHAAPAAVTPAALAPLAFYVGRWQCAGTEYDAKGAVAKQYAALEIRVAPVYPNWLRIDVYDGGMQVTSELEGIDATGAYHHVWTADDGSYGSLSAKGWTGNQLVFDEDHPAATERTRMTFTKLDATHYTHKAEVDSGHGFQLGFEKTCHKV
jgi:hypothetical protein